MVRDLFRPFFRKSIPSKEESARGKGITERRTSKRSRATETSRESVKK
jgi:hypothetical protein